MPNKMLKNNNSFQTSSTMSPDKSYGSSSVFLSPSTSSATASPKRQLYTYNEAVIAARSMPAILENGRKVYGPPRDYMGPRPSYLSEIYVTHIPRDLDELAFLCWLHRCGVVYEFRLMLDSCSATRGYAFVRFTLEEEALAAHELLNFLFINGERLRVYRSQGKNRLYISNIPKAIPVTLLESGFRQAFPEMQNFTAYAAKAGVCYTPTQCEFVEQNRGYAFVEFNDHETALEAKKRTTPGRVRMWGSDLKVQWAKPKQMLSCGTSKPERLPALQNDFCDKLRLYCLANDWCVPIVVYGSCIRNKGIQYGSILLRSSETGAVSCILLQLAVERGVYDVHVLMCEVAVQLLEREAGFPSKHYVARALDGNCAELIHSCHNSTSPQKIPISSTHFVWPTALQKLAAALQQLAQYTSEAILNAYQYSFLNINTNIPMLQFSDATFYSIFPKFRNNTSLANDFNDTEMTLLLITAEASADSVEYSSSCWRQHMPQKLRLKSQRDGRVNRDYVLQYVDVAQAHERSFYHPAQRFNTTPCFIPMHSFQKSIFKHV